MTAPLDLSIVIVSYNVVHLLRECLRSLQRNIQELDAEVWVVDNNSQDGTQHAVLHEFPWVRLIASDINLWFAGGNNAALPNCLGRYVLLLNPDTVVAPGALKTLIEYLDRHPKVGAVGPTIRLSDGSIQVECARNLPTLNNLLPWLFQLDKASRWALENLIRSRNQEVETQGRPWNPLDRLNLLTWHRRSTCEVECLSGACMLIRREVVKTVGLLDESCPLYLDDIDYCARIRQAGWHLHFVSDATIVHYWQQSTSQLDREGSLYGMACHAHWRYLRKFRNRRQASVFAIAALIAAPLRVAVSCVAGAFCTGSDRRFWQRQRAMAEGMGRWARSRRKTPPDLTASQPR